MGNTFADKGAIHSGVKVGRQKFAEYVRSQMSKGERDWSTYEIERRAQAKGHEISRTTVSNILNCKVRDVSEDKLNALAAAFEVPPAEVFAAYRGTEEEEGKIRNERLAALAADIEKLSPENIPKFEALMDYVQHTVRQMIKEQERESSSKQRRTPRVIYGDGTIQEERKKKRA
jgi:transcriptional regulator with XRE-family HTH domain